MAKPAKEAGFTALIADDHEIVRAGLRSALEKPGLIEDHGIRVIGEAADGLAALALAKTETPDLILLDISMPHATGAEIILDLQRWCPDAKIVVITGVRAPGLLAQVVSMGVDGVFLKTGSMDEVYAALPLILRGGKFISPACVEILDTASTTGETLTDRERQTLMLLVNGHTTKSIASQLGISPKTAEKHRAAIMSKLDASSVVDLVTKAIRARLIDLDTLGGVSPERER